MSEAENICDIVFSMGQIYFRWFALFVFESTRTKSRHFSPISWCGFWNL